MTRIIMKMGHECKRGLRDGEISEREEGSCEVLGGEGVSSIFHVRVRRQHNETHQTLFEKKGGGGEAKGI
jgi:hypothetical protein